MTLIFGSLNSSVDCSVNFKLLTWFNFRAKRRQISSLAWRGWHSKSRANFARWNSERWKARKEEEKEKGQKEEQKRGWRWGEGVKEKEEIKRNQALNDYGLAG